MMVKVCGMSHKENILQLVQKASPDMMGMIFYEKSPRFVSREAVDLSFFRALDIPKVGVFVNAELEDILQKIEGFALDYVQLHGDEPLEFLLQLKAASPVKIIKVIRVGDRVDWKEMKEMEHAVDLFLFDTQTEKFGGSGKQFDWSVLERYPLNRNFILSGGVNSESLGTIQALAVKVPRLIGLDINSKFEIEPGVKDIDKIRDFLERNRGSIN